MPERPTVANSSCLIALKSAGHLDILAKLYRMVTVPSGVARECGGPLPEWTDVRPFQNQAMCQSLKIQLGHGEAEAITLASELSAVRIILDDKKARRIARQLMLPVTGTMAILIRAKEQGIIRQVRDVIDALRRAGFYTSDELVEEVLREAGE